nr:hypothetical protein [Kibdelosporangium sp. MJ126-NF4]CTQ98164.1 hypothetical protein [Kibdelosporangium sp. MJ126-NF4]
MEGPVTHDGDITLSGRFVAAHDIVFNAAPPDGDAPPFLLVDREFLEAQALIPKQLYVARSPDWADVVHGSDSEVRFIERDQTEALRATVGDELIAPITRGTDRQLHSLFVLGAPGSGKTTLVRRVAAMLVLAGECVVADFGVKTDRVTPDDTATCVRALDRLAAEGTPVLVLLDDPFFANSGWVGLLQALGRPQHQGISVLGASPDFLFQRFAHRLPGRQVLVRTFEMSRPSTAEREQLAVLHHLEGASSLSSDEDLLVVAMEAAAGQSFSEIMERMWMTLNGGVPVDPATDIRRLPWPVVAFAVICHFHRYYVLCPESLLHEFLSNTLDKELPSYLAQELEDMVTREGWHIFSVHTPRHGHPRNKLLGSRLLGTTHARVARAAWQNRPQRSLDIDTGMIDASVRVPAAIPQLAEMILAHRPTQTVQLARRFAKRWNTAVEQQTIETKSLCALVRALRPSRPARLTFRGVLRKCLTAENDQSWLAAWQLYHLSSSEQNPTEKKYLFGVSLLWTLKNADLSVGPAESVEIADRMGGEFRSIIVDRLTTSLRGELDWTIDAHQVAWLLRSLPDDEVAALLELVYVWLEDDLLNEDVGTASHAALVVEALVPLLDDADGLLDGEQRARLREVVLDWQVAAPEVNHSVLLALLKIAETADEHGVSGQDILTQLFEWLRSHPESNESAWNALLFTLGRTPELTDLAREILPDAFDWLRNRPENNISAWYELLSALGRLPESTDLARQILPGAFTWLRDRPENNESAWSVLLSLLGRAPELADLAREILPEAFTWLHSRQESNETAWGALLAALGRAPGSVDLTREILPKAFEWLRDRPENNESTWGVLLSVLGRAPELTDLARDILPKTFHWLRDRPENNESAWGVLLSVLGRAPELTDLARDILPKTFHWLRDRPENNETAWNALLSALGRVPGSADLAREILPEAFDWLRDRQENNESAWNALLSALGRVPELADVAREILPDAFDWLRDRQENNETAWGALLSTLGRIPELADVARRIVPEAFALLGERPGPNKGAWSGLLVALSFPLDFPAALRAEMLEALRTWSLDHFAVDGHVLRGVRLLQLADAADPELIPTVEAELTYLEQTPDSKRLLTLVHPFAYAVARTGRDDLEARFAAWERQAHGTGYEDGSYEPPRLP